jgi:phosphoribosylanthranilate isomerase
MWIKICGMTSAEAVATALEAQIDAIGFVFASSVRRLEPAAAAALAAPARKRLCCVAVTQHPTQRQLDAILAQFAPDVLQIDAADLAALRVPRTLEVLPVLRVDRPAPAPLPARVLFEGSVSGTGVPCDWSAAQTLARRTELVLAGGLRPENVAAAIATVRPYGVDVSSGVEERPGLKSPARMLEFVTAVRSADRDLAGASARQRQ